MHILSYILSYSLLAIVVVYGFTTYRFRERRHLNNIEAIRRGGLPAGDSLMVLRFRVLTSAIVGVLLLGLVTWFAVMTYGSGRYEPPLLGITLFFLVLLAIVVFLFADAMHNLLDAKQKEKT